MGSTHEQKKTGRPQVETSRQLRANSRRTKIFRRPTSWPLQDYRKGYGLNHQNKRKRKTHVCCSFESTRNSRDRRSPHAQIRKTNKSRPRLQDNQKPQTNENDGKIEAAISGRPPGIRPKNRAANKHGGLPRLSGSPRTRPTQKHSGRTSRRRAMIFPAPPAAEGASITSSR